MTPRRRFGRGGGRCQRPRGSGEGLRGETRGWRGGWRGCGLGRCSLPRKSGRRRRRKKNRDENSQEHMDMRFQWRRESLGHRSRTGWKLGADRGGCAPIFSIAARPGGGRRSAVGLVSFMDRRGPSCCGSLGTYESPLLLCLDSLVYHDRVGILGQQISSKTGV